jgi:beta-lactamase superfamily II metal-dependent hydrolase
MSWQDSFDTHIWIFGIGRGMAAFVRTGLNHGFIIDMGCSDEFQPAEFIRENFSTKLSKYKDFRIAQAVLSHPHRDHIQQCDQLGNGKHLHAKLLSCPNDKQTGEEFDWDRIGEDDREGSAELVQTYRDLFAKRTPGLQTIQYETNRQLGSELEYGLYYVRPPVCDSFHPDDDNEYGNATSIMFYLRYGINTILFTGDMTPEGMRRVLDDGKGVEKRFTIFKSSFLRDHPNWFEKTSDQPGIRTLLEEYGLSVLVAPHHGLESCYSKDLYDAIEGGKPQLVVISEKRHTRPQDGKLHARYQREDGATGLNVFVDGTRQKRYSVSTANGHHVLIVFNGTGVPKVYLDKDPKELLDLVN